MIAKLPYVDGMLHPATRAWADKWPPVELVPLASDTAYHDALVGWWRQPGPLVIVEQNMLPVAGILYELAWCPYDWCTSPYVVDAKWCTTGLGCAKFSHGLRRLHPTMAADATDLQDTLDARLAHLLVAAGYRPHVHRASHHFHDRCPQEPISEASGLLNPRRRTASSGSDGQPL